MLMVWTPTGSGGVVVVVRWYWQAWLELVGWWWWLWWWWGGAGKVVLVGRLNWWGGGGKVVLVGW
jgi:hypothetical protein